MHDNNFNNIELVIILDFNIHNNILMIFNNKMIINQDKILVSFVNQNYTVALSSLMYSI